MKANQQTMKSCPRIAKAAYIKKYLIRTSVHSNSCTNTFLNHHNESYGCNTHLRNLYYQVQSIIKQQTWTEYPKYHCRNDGFSCTFQEAGTQPRNVRSSHSNSNMSCDDITISLCQSDTSLTRGVCDNDGHLDCQSDYLQLKGSTAARVPLKEQTLSLFFLKQTCHPTSFTSWLKPHICSVPLRNISTHQGLRHSSLSRIFYNGTSLSAITNQRSRAWRCASPTARLPYYVQCRHFTKNVNFLEEDVVTTSEIQKFLAESDMKFEQGFTCFITTCPKLNKKKGSCATDKLYINMTTGHFLCGACGKLGGWHELKDNISLTASLKKKKIYECFKDVDSVQHLKKDLSRVMETWSDTLPVKDLTEEQVEQLRSDLDCQTINKATLEKFGVQYNPGNRCLVFPYHNLHGEVLGLKKITCRLAETDGARTLRETSVPRTGSLGLFGWNTIGADTKEVVMTTSELNAMAAYQETKVPALSLPRGYAVLAQEVLPSLERFKKILLWFGDDIRAWAGAKQFANKLNSKRCFVIRPTSEDPSPFRALNQGLRLKAILSKAKPLSHKSIVSFPQLRQEVFSELAHVEQVSGVKWRRYPALNRLLKGHRRGELTVFTGPTGSGKTTFMSDYSLDLCMQGVNTMWGSFEINNVRLGKMMLTQFAMKNLSKNLHEFDHWANWFEELPMFFMTFHGQESIKRVIETMSHAVYVHDIAHIIVDNLQFMMGVNGDMTDRFTRQDMIISAFRRFATTMNCHVSLVIHPRKEKDTDELTTASIFGSAKASQEADNVLLLQDKRLSSLRGRKYVQVTKNRFDGELGIMLLKFDKESLSFAVRDKPKKPDGKKLEEVEEEKVETEENV
ncbi:twinkle mtDNA helicase-like [Haliotis cracherodii]|uniref:twinkle mtDNA helicase-like n=1 Tax=Haliotis cracherodii TaxID=6455 RepID=UPI0039E812AA